MTGIGFDPTMLALDIAKGVIGFILCFIIYTLYANRVVPGFWQWAKAGITNTLVVLNSYMDGYGEYRTAKKEPGSMIMNINKPDEFLDRSVVDKKPMAMLHGHRYMIRVTATNMPSSPDEYADTQRILDHIDENAARYPLLSKLQDYEIFEALGEDQQTARELLAVHCQVETEYLVEGVVTKRPDNDVAREIKDNVDKYMAELAELRKHITWIPRRSVFVDLARCIDATQQRYASQIFKRYRTEMMQYLRAQYGGIENSLWKGVAMGGAVGAVAGAIAATVLGGM